MLVKLVRVSDTRADKSFYSADEGPECSTISLSNNVFGNAITSSMPAGRDLTGNCSAKLEGLGNKDTGTLLQLNEPLSILSSPNVAFLIVLKLEFLGFNIRDLNWFKVVNKLNLLVKYLLVRIVATEKFRFCKDKINKVKLMDTRDELTN